MVRRVRIQGVVLKEVASTVATRMINSIRIQSLVLPSFRNQKQIKIETRTHAFNKAASPPSPPLPRLPPPNGGGG